ncbi:MAG: gluconate 2-dehydrogenase subunit 3 family protein [Ktedonobacteraceae bacterium]|nr:gluconate 2-dehydrogenase subunit 3 family protein [Ktedonobacteraceae bacterium]
MKDWPRFTPPPRKQTIDLSREERALLNAVIDRLIPADENFPPPSTLHVLDAFLRHLLPHVAHKTNLGLTERRLRAALNDLNAAAGGDFCHASPEKQQSLLNRLERRDPALFQALWTLANHCYYSHLAKQRSALLS